MDQLSTKIYRALQVRKHSNQLSTFAKTEPIVQTNESGIDSRLQLFQPQREYFLTNAQNPNALQKKIKRRREKRKKPYVHCSVVPSPALVICKLFFFFWQIVLALPHCEQEDIGEVLCTGPKKKKDICMSWFLAVVCVVFFSEVCA